jgi:hypothetical protein
MKKNKILTLLLVITCECFILSCSKDKETSDVSSTTPFELRMTDAIANYNAVNIDVQAIEVKTDIGATIMLNVNPGVYNLLDYANGVDTLIATGSIPTATVSQVRLILGNNNSVVDSNGVLHPMDTPSAQESGLKLNVHAALQPGVTYAMLIDFDANRSIVVTGNGQYKLKPVIRVISQALTGSIHGTVAPASALPATVLAINGTDTVTTTTDASGNFLFQGMASATYSVVIVPQSPHLIFTYPNVSVSVGVMTELNIITIP